MTNTPSWYDLLDVEPDASADEIRTAWKSSIADLDPADRRFRMRNQAAEVLLDPASRAAYDAERDEHDGPRGAAPPAGGVALAEEQPESVRRVAQAPPAPVPAPAPPVAKPTTTRTASRAPGLRVLAGLAVVAVLLVAATVVALVRGGSAADGEIDDASIEAARSAAEAAIVPVLSYDYRQLDQDQATAAGYLTSSYSDEYDRVWEQLDDVAPKDETVVQVEVVDSAVVRTGDDRVDVLLFVDRPTTQKDQPTPVVSKDQVTARMVLSDGTWLIDGLSTGT